MKKILFVFLMSLSVVVAIAQEQTPSPVIIVEENLDNWVVRAYGEGEVFLFQDDDPVENPFSIWLIQEEQHFIFKAYAQAEGCLPSEWVYREVIVPAIEDPILPVEPDYGVHATLTDESVILEPFVDPAYFDNCTYVIRLCIDGVEVEYPCTLPRSQEEYVVHVTVQIDVEGLGYSFVCDRDIVVPALETVPPYQKNDVNGDGEVNIADVNVVIDIILSDTFGKAFDVNDDGEVNIADINDIINYIIDK